MDLGCIDMGCVEKPRKETSLEKGNSPKESVRSASKSATGKNSKAKDVVRSSLNALNKLTSQISKPPRRKTSPINWFPRKKVEPYLKRKIKMLQEVDGMHSTLDETLGDSNPHYSKVLREKIAIREAAERAMEARKAAMVEASWCRILHAARIENKGAEAHLVKAEQFAAEAFEAARAVGVIMNDSQNHYKVETSSATTHTVSATFESAFEIDKQVARAVKSAFVKLANCPSINKDEFKELLRKISENPENHDNDTFNFDSECEPNIVDMMLGRIRCLKEDELASLSTIVATSGLNAALSESGNSKRNSLLSSSDENNEKNLCTEFPRRMSVSGRGKAEVELPSLDKFLVKRLTRLEREVLEAKNTLKNEAFNDEKRKDGSNVHDLESMLVKNGSKLEKEVEETRTNSKPSKMEELPSLDKFLVKRLTRLEREVEEARNGKKIEPGERGNANESITGNASMGSNISKYESLDKVLVKHVSRLEKEKSNMCADERMRTKPKRKDIYREPESCEGSLDQVLVKHKSRLEREKTAGVHDVEQQQNEDSTRHSVSRRQAREREVEAAWGGLSLGNSMRPRVREAKNGKKVEPDEGGGAVESMSTGKENLDSNKTENKSIGSNYESLDKLLVKHVSRLEKEKLNCCADEQMRFKAKSSEGSLDQVLVKHKSEEDSTSTTHSIFRRQARERELEAAWGGLSLGNSMRPHVSRLQRDKAAWIKAEEEERTRAMEDEV